ncbi:MAG: lipid-A-disaccharide synthase [Bacteroidota bacterium]
MKQSGSENKRYFIIAGEASGDLHASNLVREIKKLEPGATFAGFGGDLMQEQGVTILKHYREMDFMGFIEVILNLRTIMRNMEFCKKALAEFQPDVVILIDYPGFNLRIAPFAKELGAKVVYYISPQIWAWKQNRVYKIREVVDRMLVILPFEKEFYARFDVTVDFVGHPLLDALENSGSDFATGTAFREKYNLADKPVIALLPGSRSQEISSKLPVMLNMIDRFPAYQFVIAKAKSQPMPFYEQLCKGYPITIIENATYEVLKNATAACVTSGTATLETALFQVPEVVCYKGNKLSYLIARQLIKVKFISLVNLIMDREVVKELIQDEFNASNLEKELNAILNGPKAVELKKEYELLREKLGGPGASARAAAIVHEV